MGTIIRGCITIFVGSWVVRDHTQHPSSESPIVQYQLAEFILLMPGHLKSDSPKSRNKRHVLGEARVPGTSSWGYKVECLIKDPNLFKCNLYFFSKCWTGKSWTSWLAREVLVWITGLSSPQLMIPGCFDVWRSQVACQAEHTMGDWLLSGGGRLPPSLEAVSVIWNHPKVPWSWGHQLS